MGKPWVKPAFPELQQREAQNVYAQRRLIQQMQRALKSDSWTRRYDAVASLLTVRSRPATDLLLQMMDDDDSDVAYRAASELVARNEQTAVPSILRLLTNKYQRYRDHGRLIASLMSMDSMRFATQHRQWWPLLAADCNKESLSHYADITYLTYSQKVKMAEILSGRERPCSAKLLIPLSRDSSVGVRLAAARALGFVKAPSVISELHRLLLESDVDVQRAAAEALSKLAGPESVEVIRVQIMNSETPLRVTVPLLYALGHVATEESAILLADAAEKYEDTVGWHAYRLLGDMHATQMLPRLWQRLKWHEAETQKWREYRDRTSSDRLEPSDESRFVQQRPASFALFELVTTIARLDESETVLSLLGHNLSDVRDAAALGLAVRGKAEIVARLDSLRAGSEDPFFRHSVFRALDMSLEVIQSLGDEYALRQLKILRDQIRDRDGVLSRLDWTINEIEATLYEQARPATSTD